jgi:HEAT repeat protein
METRADEIGLLLEQTRDRDPRVRLRAVVRLCPCHVKRNHNQIWDRLIAMATDEDPKIRGAVLHGLTDGSPRPLELEIVSVLERMHGDSDPKVRRRARQILAHYRRIGVLNIS